MRRITVIGMIILGLVALPLMAAAKSDKTPDKIEICHVDDDGETRTIEVSEKAKTAHLNHGDVEGACGEALPADLPALTASFIVSSIVCEPGFFGVPCTLDLDASGSQGAISYQWMYADGLWSGTASGPTPSIEGLRKGTTVAVSLTVTGEDGGEDFLPMTILMFDTPTP